MKLPIYLDYSSTTPIDESVLKAMMPFLTSNFGNASNRLNYYGLMADIAIKKARANVAKLINAKEEEIFFTSGATESNNLAIKGILQSCSANKNHIITTEIEHSSVLEVCKYLQSIGYKVDFIKPDINGAIDIKQVEKFITKSTTLISIMHVNNETGVINSIKDIANLARHYNIIFHTDCTQSIDKLPIDVKYIGIDMLSFSAHKIYGPKGCGVLYIDSKYLNKIEPLVHGGGQERGLRSGTFNTPAIMGLSKAVEQINTSENNILNLRTYFESELEHKLNIIINGKNTHRVSNISNITFKGVSAERLMLKLQNKVACSVGSACLNEKSLLSHVLTSMGLSDDDIKSTIRFSLGRYTSHEEIDYALKSIINSIRA